MTLAVVVAEGAIGEAAAPLGDAVHQIASSAARLRRESIDYGIYPVLAFLMEVDFKYHGAFLIV